jgi:hypothetical protein
MNKPPTYFLPARDNSSIALSFLLVFFSISIDPFVSKNTPTTTSSIIHNASNHDESRQGSQYGQS